MPGPLWPGGPAELPGVIELSGARYTVPAVPGLRLAWAIGRGVMIVPELLSSTDRTEVHRRLRHVTDPLDHIDTQRATVMMAAALAGIDSGVNGWRAAIRLCASLVSDWPHSGGALMEVGVRPGQAPLWEICAGLYWMFIDNPQAKPEERKQARQALFAPLRGEPEWMRPARPPPVMPTAEATAGALALYERVTGQKPQIRPCAECGRLGGHTAACSAAPRSLAGPAPCRSCGGQNGRHAQGCSRASVDRAQRI